MRIDMLEYLNNSDAKFSLYNRQTGNRLTFRTIFSRKYSDRNVYLILLNGDTKYVGYIRGKQFNPAPTKPSVASNALTWYFNKLHANVIPKHVETSLWY